MSDQQQIFTLKQVVSSIRKTIESRYQQAYWVKAEMHKLNRYPSGHCFPELLQKENGKVVAQMSGSIWSHNFDKINKRFMEVVKEPLKDDTTLLMQVKVSFHEMYGISLQILDIDPNYSLGELQKERLETLKRLKEENLINANQLLPFPLLPKRIAVISADSSKGLSDFYKVIEQNEWGYRFFKMLFPSYLQGDQAANSIMNALSKIERVKDHFDVVVIVRGGGGEVGLSCYNNYELCRAIASFPLPILTGIGHSTNLTVAEMIAYRNAITPTELGDFLIQAFHNFSVPLKDAIKTIRVSSLNILSENKHILNKLSADFNHVSIQRIRHEQHAVREFESTIKGGSKYLFMDWQKSILAIRRELIHGAQVLINENQNSLNSQWVELKNTSKSMVRDHQSSLEQLVHSIRLMDPVNVLKRGYTITTFNGKLIRDIESIREGDIIETVSESQILTSEVKTKTDKND